MWGDLGTWREMGASLMLAVVNTLVALMLIFLSVLLVIAISLLSRGAGAVPGKHCSSPARLRNERASRP